MKATHGKTLDPAAPPAGARRGVSRGAFCLIAAALFVVILIAFPGGAWLLAPVPDGMLLVLWLLAAAGAGSLVPVPGRDADGHAVLRWVTAAAMGVGTFTLVTLGLGLAGLLNRGTAFGLLVAGIACLAARFRSAESREAAGRWWREPIARGHWLLLAVVPLPAMSVVAALMPPGILWNAVGDPHAYDVLAYHLQLPREWYELGRIAPLGHNAFSYFPLAVETQYLLAMHLRGGPWDGMYLAQLVHATLCGLTVAAAYGVARAVAGRTAAIVAALTAAAFPWLWLLAPVAYNEGGLLLFGTLAVGHALVALQSERAVRHMLVGGAMAGFACGAKLTAVPVLAVAVPLVWCVVALARRAAPLPLPRVVTAVAGFIVVAGALFAPWPIRNAVWTGNPLFPEAQAVLGRGHFDEAQAERWRQAHAPRADQRGLAPRVSAAYDQIVRDWRYGFALLPLSILAVALAWKHPASWVLGGVLASLVLFWLGFTHLQSRFFVLAIPVCAIAVGMLDRWRPVVAGAAVVLTVVSFGQVFTRLLDVLYAEPFPFVSVLGVDRLDWMTPEAATAVPPDATLVLAGDARAFAYPRPMSRLRYRTVFDVKASGGGNLIDAWVGPGRGDAVILVDPNELRRFAETYRQLPPLPADVAARREPFLVE